MLISTNSVMVGFFSNLDPTPYINTGQILFLPDTVYAHQKIFISPYFIDFAKIKLYCHGHETSPEIDEISSTLSIPAFPDDTSNIVFEITGEFAYQRDTVTIISERWLEFFLDPDLQFSILWEGARPITYSLISSGRSQSPTSAAHTKIFDKKPSSEFYDGGLMRWWMSIQRTHNVKVITDSGEERFFPVLENGTHAPLSGTYHFVGNQASHGCIRNPLAKVYYDILEVGDRVEMHYRNSGNSYRHERINRAYRYLNWDALLEVDSSLSRYVEDAKLRISKEFGLNNR